MATNDVGLLCVSDNKPRSVSRLKESSISFGSWLHWDTILVLVVLFLAVSSRYASKSSLLMVIVIPHRKASVPIA